MVCLLLACVSYALAEGNQYLHIHTADGWKVLDLEKVDRLSFSGNQMIAADENNVTVETFDRSGLAEMYVDETSGVNEIASDAADATFSYKQGVATMLADGLFEVYGLDGSLMVAIKAKKGENIDLTAMTQEIVILKSGKFTAKVVLR